MMDRLGRKTSLRAKTTCLTSTSLHIIIRITTNNSTIRRHHRHHRGTVSTPCTTVNIQNIGATRRTRRIHPTRRTPSTQKLQILGCRTHHSNSRTDTSLTRDQYSMAHFLRLHRGTVVERRRVRGQVQAAPLLQFQTAQTRS